MVALFLEAGSECDRAMSFKVRGFHTYRTEETGIIVSPSRTSVPVGICRSSYEQVAGFPGATFVKRT